jgi:hypothetical protein
MREDLLGCLDLPVGQLSVVSIRGNRLIHRDVPS